jgi:hypothetical protein
VTNFIYEGLYYPVIGSAAMFENRNNKLVISRKLGGYGDYYVSWFPNYGIKCKLHNPDKPYKQLVIDAINDHPDMELYKFYFNDTGFSSKEGIYVVCQTNKQPGYNHRKYRRCLPYY